MAILELYPEDIESAKNSIDNAYRQIDIQIANLREIKGIIDSNWTNKNEVSLKNCIEITEKKLKNNSAGFKEISKDINSILKKARAAEKLDIDGIDLIKTR